MSETESVMSVCHGLPCYKCFKVLSRSNLINFNKIMRRVMFLHTWSYFLPASKAIFRCNFVKIKQKTSESSDEIVDILKIPRNLNIPSLERPDPLKVDEIRALYE